MSTVRSPLRARSRAVGYRFGRFLPSAVPLAVSHCDKAGDGDDELREYCLQVRLSAPSRRSPHNAHASATPTVPATRPTPCTNHSHLSKHVHTSRAIASTAVPTPLLLPAPPLWSLRRRSRASCCAPHTTHGRSWSPSWPRGSSAEGPADRRCLWLGVAHDLGLVGQPFK
jgi:hypothetical protein